MMKATSKDVPMRDVKLENAHGAKIQWLYSKFDGTKTFSMRKFTIKPGGTIPEHYHRWEHEIYILDGMGMVTAGKDTCRVRDGEALYIPGDEPHGYSNLYKDDFVFICMIPNIGDQRHAPYYTLTELRKEGKPVCVECQHAIDKKGCSIAYMMNTQPEEFYWTVGGSIIGCEHGEKKK